ncbi:hypothetical protein Q8W37_11575 [Shimia thalassica]|uniref:hypothetical protein n=1 Tax=Shimia thalassica TaxID=1715693 RepID=UPI0027353C58|nr:hypothetical protein [Shimia thalassica]MDP2580574.1 hypothetical protein [Shimia thalassica]
MAHTELPPFHGEGYNCDATIQTKGNEKGACAMERDLTEDYQRYVEAAGKALLAAMSVYDLATASNKMMSFDCVGDDNDAWKDGPFMSAGKGEVQIDRSRPYCLAISKEFSVSATLVIGPNPTISRNGGVKLPFSEGSNEFGNAEKTISKLIIIEQFEIFKDFWVKHDGPYNAKQAQKWRGQDFDDVLDHLEILTKRRNELVHNDPCESPKIREAVEFYYGLRTASETLAAVPRTAGASLRSLMP